MESHSPQKIEAERIAAGAWGGLGLEWSQAGRGRERHWEEGRRNEREERARHANSSALPPSNQNRILGRQRPVRKERGQESRALGGR